jgi:hypothetical protein
MLALRFAAVLGLVFWVGGLAVLGSIAAPALFDALGAARGPEGRALAGAAFGATLQRFQFASYICAGIILGSLVVRAVLGPRPRHFAARMILSVLMIAASAWTGFVLIPQIARAQLALGAPALSPGADDPRRQEFGRLHGMSTALQFVPLVGGLALLLFELKD